MYKLNSRDSAPKFDLKDQNGRSVTLDGFRGGKLLIYFYPKADTPGCTKQSCSVSHALPGLKEIGVAAVGISPDTPEKQSKFDQKYNLGFPLLCDEDHAVARAYGAFGPKSSGGIEKEGIIRSSFLIDEEGKIVQAWYGVKPEDTVPQAIQAIEGE